MASDLRKLSEAATPGEWEATEYTGESWWLEREIRRVNGQSVIGWTADIDDDAFIVALANAYRSGQLVEAEEVVEVLQFITDQFDELVNRHYGGGLPVSDEQASGFRALRALLSKLEGRG